MHHERTARKPIPSVGSLRVVDKRSSHADDNSLSSPSAKTINIPVFASVCVVLKITATHVLHNQDDFGPILHGAKHADDLQWGLLSVKQKHGILLTPSCRELYNIQKCYPTWAHTLGWCNSLHRRISRFNKTVRRCLFFAFHVAVLMTFKATCETRGFF
jgi:hypothetical protein